MMAPIDDPHDLARFVRAQDRHFDAIVAELAAGRKRTHWMWYVFPQLAGLGTSGMAMRYAIADRAEALAYRTHPVLGTRLVACTQHVLDVRGGSLHDVFGSPDDLKFRSSMTLFAAVDPHTPQFAAALERHCGGPDARTLALLDAG